MTLNNKIKTDYVHPYSTIKVINNLPVELKYQTEYLIEGQFKKNPISSIPPGHKGVIFEINSEDDLGPKGGVIYYYDDNLQHRKYILFEFNHPTEEKINDFFLSEAPANIIKWSKQPDESGNVVYILHDFQ